MFKKRKNINKKGFSLLEAILSVFVLSTAMVAVLGLMASNLKDSLDAMDQETAGFLAQEGTELARNIRDTNWKNNQDSFDSSSFPASSTVGQNVGCRAKYNDAVFSVCNGANMNNKILNLDNNNEFYISPGSGTSTKFARQIKIEYLPDDATKDYAKITSMVTWSGGTPNFPDITNCNTVNKCAFAQVTLSRWGE